MVVASHAAAKTAILLFDRAGRAELHRLTDVDTVAQEVRRPCERRDGRDDERGEMGEMRGEERWERL